jgi:microcystin degradation protein MlrC
MGSRQHLRAGFEPIARHILLIAGPGVCSSDLRTLRYEKIRRPIHPLDEGLGPDA